ncbi:MAG TPA: hypothetical protein VMD31_01605 [Opitutaceae bacterium]|nr:hypothetical protein [Opitutaceae bacterium]
MKTKSPISRVLAVLIAAGLAADARAYTVGGKMDMAVVAEFGDPSLAPAAPSAEHPAYYVAYDGGYIEAGDPIAGERPPTAGAVARNLAATLASQHYLAATPGIAPSLVLVYHWGRLNRDSYQLRTSTRLQPNLLARIALVTPREYGRRIEEDLLDRRQPVGTQFPILDITERNLLQLVADNRYFVVVSAYDFGSVTQGAAKLAWRLKASTRSAGVGMNEALAALLRGGAPFLGRNLSQTQLLRTPLAPEGAGGAGGLAPETMAPAPEVVRPLDPAYLQGLIQHDHALFTGELTAEARDAWTATARPDPGTAFLPPALAARIHAYAQEKSALQEALAVVIKQHTPGPDTRQAIDGFSRDNAARIAALTTERKAIRDELARLAAASADAQTGQSLEALRQEFATDLQQLAANPAGGD